ncbi:MAG: ABC-F family ATP-binding cassette domain-containing protein [Firmicutes bacterium]|nr:ABC-F family ATP-binding cassette domain-containing protein [Bacillota bacterium]
MIDIAVNELHKYYGSNHVLKGITFEVYSGEKIGLLGKNGSGKTTLFKIIAGDELYESGSLSKASGKKVEILAQIPDFGETDTVEDILYSSFAEIIEIGEAMKKIEGSFAPGCMGGQQAQLATSQSALQQYGKLMGEYERLGGYEVDVRVEKICGGMNIGENLRKSPFRLLSGGEKTRVNLARILLRDCDILLLDEPTNHLDLTSLEWLEKFLRDFKGTVFVISHDRVFLDNVVTRIIELDGGRANFYSGNYSFYVEEKEQRYLTQAEQYKQQQRKIKQLQKAIARLKVWHSLNSTSGHDKRFKAIEKSIEQMEKVEKPITSKKMAEDFNSGGHAAKQLVSFDSVIKGYGTNVLLDDVSIIIGRNDSIALIGANGCGKTTLIRLIMDEEPCDSGIVKVSTNVKIAYMPQIIRFDDENATILEALRNVTGLPEERNRAILAGFRFKAPDVIKKVGNLSGGEKSRLKLCLLMQNKANFLILDEPTNHLDIESREWIEEAVADFEGTMLFISHDRYFLNKFASRIWSMKDGRITDFHGSFDDFLKFSANDNKTNLPVTDKKKKKPAVKPKQPPVKKVSVETLIYEAETELGKVNAEIEAGILSTDYERLKPMYEKKQELEEQIEALYSEWTEEGENGGHGNA